jgi:HK97 family phage major capsid protein
MSPGMLWNRTVIPTPALNAGEFLVGTFATGASLHDRMQANVLISTEDRDNFIKNMVTLLGEERCALAVRRPGCFVTGNLSQTSSGA